MRLSDFLVADQIVVIDPPADKQALLEQLAGLAVTHRPGLDRQSICKRLLDREQQGSTGVGLGIAIPHCTVDGLDDNHLIVCRVRGGLEFEALDDEPVHLVFAVLAPQHRPGRYLQLLARITRLVNHEDFRRRLIAEDDPRALYRLLLDQDANHAGPAR